MNNTYDVIIIGGGVIGTACAFEMSKNGLKVAVLEKRHVASGASGSSAAMLECQTDAYRGDNFLSLAVPSLRLFPLLHEEIKTLIGEDFGYENCGVLQLAMTPEEAVFLENETIRFNYWKLKSQWLSPKEVAEIYPQLSKNIFGGAFFEEDGQVVGERLTATLAKAALLKGANIFEGVQIEKFEHRGGQINELKTSKGSYSAKKFIVAAGAWSDEVLAPLGIKLGVVPVRGQLLVLDTPRRPIDHPVFTKSSGYITPKKDGYTLVGTTIEKAGFDEKPSEEARIKLHQKAQALMPGITNKERGMIAGLRPSSPDEMPILGALFGFKNLLAATGHHRRGILLAPITAKIMTALALEKPSPINISPFSPHRFTSEP